MQLVHDYCKNPASAIVFLVALGITAVLVFGLVYGVLDFFMVQVAALFRIYFIPLRALEQYHPYTRLILRNELVDLHRLRELRALTQTPDVEMQSRGILERVIYTLDASEPATIKRQIISQLRRACR